MAQTTVEVMKDHDAQVAQFGCNGKTPQATVAVSAAVAATASTNASPFGYTTQAQADGIVTLLNQIRNALVANGILS